MEINIDEQISGLRNIVEIHEDMLENLHVYSKQPEDSKKIIKTTLEAFWSMSKPLDNFMERKEEIFSLRNRLKELIKKCN